MHSHSFIDSCGARPCRTGQLGLLLVFATLAGCGLKGDLYLPEKQAPVVITPAASEAATSAASSSASSESSQATP